MEKLKEKMLNDKIDAMAVMIELTLHKLTLKEDHGKIYNFLSINGFLLCCGRCDEVIRDLTPELRRYREQVNAEGVKK